MPLDNFIDILVNKDLKPLIISGEPLQSDLNQAWQDIYTEYCDICPNDAVHLSFMTLKGIRFLQGKLAVIGVILSCMEQPIPEFIEILHEYNFPFTYTEETLKNDLYATEIQAKSLEVQLELLIDDYNKQINKDDGKATSKYDYEELLAMLSKYQGYELNGKVLTVSRFVAIFNQYKKNNQPHGIERVN